MSDRRESTGVDTQQEILTLETNSILILMEIIILTEQKSKQYWNRFGLSFLFFNRFNFSKKRKRSTNWRKKAKSQLKKSKSITSIGVNISIKIKIELVSRYSHESYRKKLQVYYGPDDFCDWTAWGIILQTTSWCTGKILFDTLKEPKFRFE